ncbi:MAG: hypothetical protein COB15_06260 [Flavobacteriales bacterium]|nr:MAG: hypothetical protein COB15_06260 [Flavobacteriales bacterium]
MDFNHIEYKKKFYPVNKSLENYLFKYKRTTKLPIKYSDLLNYAEVIPITSKGKNTLWSSVIYRPSEMSRITESFIKIYQLLSADGCDIKHLYVGSIDFCSYANSKPFRIKIINEINDNHDYYYIKKTDASRIYGLELEHILSPNKINFLSDKETLVEEHIIGIPGDQFINDYVLGGMPYDKIRLAKEFVKFNERCFVRLLGDMRSYNFVIEIKQDFDKVQYRIRAMDFDQQSYEGGKNIYLPQFFKDNISFVNLAQEHISLKTAEQYCNEARSLLKKRLMLAKNQYQELLEIMKNDTISSQENIFSLRKELAKHYKDPEFEKAESMGEILSLNIKNKLGISF